MGKKNRTQRFNMTNAFSKMLLQRLEKIGDVKVVRGVGSVTKLQIKRQRKQKKGGLL